VPRVVAGKGSGNTLRKGGKLEAIRMKAALPHHEGSDKKWVPTGGRRSVGSAKKKTQRGKAS